MTKEVTLTLRWPIILCMDLQRAEFIKQQYLFLLSLVVLVLMDIQSKLMIEFNSWGLDERQTRVGSSFRWVCSSFRCQRVVLRVSLFCLVFARLFGFDVFLESSEGLVFVFFIFLLFSLLDQVCLASIQFLFCSILVWQVQHLI